MDEENAGIFSILNKKNAILNVLNALPDDLRKVIKEIHLIDKEIAMIAIKSGDAGLIHYMSNWDYEKILKIMPKINSINPSHMQFLGYQSDFSSFQKTKDYEFYEEIYLIHLAKLFDLKHNFVDEFKFFIEKLFEFENNLVIKKISNELFMKIAITPHIASDVKKIYDAKVKWSGKLAEIAELDKRFDEIINHIQNCEKKYNIKNEINSFTVEKPCSIQEKGG